MAAPGAAMLKMHDYYITEHKALCVCVCVCVIESGSSLLDTGDAQYAVYSLYLHGMLEKPW